MFPLLVDFLHVVFRPVSIRELAPFPVIMSMTSLSGLPFGGFGFTNSRRVEDFYVWEILGDSEKKSVDKGPFHRSLASE